jgi:hypothetical protein
MDRQHSGVYQMRADGRYLQKVYRKWMRNGLRQLFGKSDSECAADVENRLVECLHELRLAAQHGYLKFGRGGIIFDYQVGTFSYASQVDWIKVLPPGEFSAGGKMFVASYKIGKEIPVIYYDRKTEYGAVVLMPLHVGEGGATFELSIRRPPYLPPE